MNKQSAGPFGKNIILRRKALGMTQEELAEKVGIHRNVLARIELGKGFGREDTRIAIAQVLKCSLSDLYSSPAGESKISPSELASLIEPALILAKLSPLRRALILTFATNDIQYFDALDAGPDILRSAQGLLKAAR